MDKREKMKEEAVSRLRNLISSLNLNPNLVKYFKQGKVYYSYLTAGGMVGSIDTIDYIPKYAEIIKKFEKTYEGIVYHAVEDCFGMLSLLYVSKNEEDWPFERPEGKYLYAMVYNFDKEKLKNGEYDIEFEEFGTIIVKSLGGAIVRVG